MKLMVHAVLHAVASVEVEVLPDGFTMVTVPEEYHLSTPCAVLGNLGKLADDGDFIGFVRGVSTKQLADAVAHKLGKQVDEHAKREYAQDVTAKAEA